MCLCQTWVQFPATLENWCIKSKEMWSKSKDQVTYPTWQKDIAIHELDTQELDLRSRGEVRILIQAAEMWVIHFFPQIMCISVVPLVQNVETSRINLVAMDNCVFFF